MTYKTDRELIKTQREIIKKLEGQITNCHQLIIDLKRLAEINDYFAILDCLEFNGWVSK